MEIKCQFGRFMDETYRANIYLEQIPENVTQVKFIGQHHKGKTNADVTYIQFNYCQFTRVPQGLTRIFPNLEILSILISNLKTLTKADLAEYRNFKQFYFEQDQLEFLPHDLFEGFEKLEAINFDKNQLKLIEPRILDGLNRLRYAYFTSSPNYNIKYDVVGTRNRELFGKFKNLLWEKFHENIFNFQKPRAIKACKSTENIVQELQGRIHDMTIDHAEKTEMLKGIIESLKGQLQIYETKTRQLEVHLESKDVKNQQLEVDLMTKRVETERLGFYLKTKQAEIDQLELENQQLKVHLQDQRPCPTSALQTFVQQDHSFKDFRIKIADREFLVHKLLLAARSPTLAEMLRNNPEADCLHLVDIPVGIFEQILDFLYTDKLPIGTGSSSESDRGTNFVHLFAAAGRLKIEELKNHAAVMIGEDIGAENALAVLKMSNKYGHAGLRMKAFEEIKRKYPKVEFKDEWMKNYEKVKKIVEAFEEHEEDMRKVNEKFWKMMEMDCA